MTIALPKWFDILTSRQSIRPYSHYVTRKPWKLRTSVVANQFQGTFGLYALWWIGDLNKIATRLAQFTFNGEPYIDFREVHFGHNILPVYVGLTSSAAGVVGSRPKGRMVDRLVRFPTGMKRYLTGKGERRLVNWQLRGPSRSFYLFDFPEKIRQYMGKRTRNLAITLEEAQKLFDEQPHKYADVIHYFQSEYYDLFYDNYAISYVPFSSEIELFYAEALAIGLLRPCFNRN